MSVAYWYCGVGHWGYLQKALAIIQLGGKKDIVYQVFYRFGHTFNNEIYISQGYSHSQKQSD
jgi:hypothetical protein